MSDSVSTTILQKLQNYRHLLTKSKISKTLVYVLFMCYYKTKKTEPVMKKPVRIIISVFAVIILCAGGYVADMFGFFAKGNSELFASANLK